MRRPLTPLWLAAPSRCAGLAQGRAWIAIGVLVAVLVATLSALAVPSGQTDAGLYETVIEGVRHRGNYYAVAADALRGGGYPLHPFLAFRLPTLVVVSASVPPVVMLGLLYALAATVAVAWYVRLQAALARRGAQAIAALLIAAALVPILQPVNAVLPETWAGLLVAASLALRRSGRWIEPVAFALAAVLLSEFAALYLVVMAVFAWGEGERRETLGCAVALAVFAAAMAAHAHAVAEVVRPLDMPAAPLELFGFGLFVRTASESTLLAVLPLWLAGPMIGIALFGWATWRDATAVRLLVFAALVALAIALFGTPDTPHWGLLLAPLLLPGLVFAADGLRDLIGAALDSRRITVTRVVR